MKNSISCLGPKGTYTEIAAKKFAYITNIKDLKYYNTITDTMNALNVDCNYSVIPIENSIDGFVQVSLDLLMNSSGKIIGELTLPISFNLVTKAEKISDIKKLFVQFKSKGQCTKFIEGLSSDTKILITESNGESYEQLLNGESNVGAIIPSHIEIDKSLFGKVLYNIADYENNETRFFLIGNKTIDILKKEKYKTSIIVKTINDCPGGLVTVLNEFKERNINMKSIISRPNKTELGKYSFYIDLEGSEDDENLKIALENIKLYTDIKILGSYSSINHG